MMGINIFEIDGFEADDLIGTLSKFAEGKGMEFISLQGMRCLELASDNIRLLSLRRA